MKQVLLCILFLVLFSSTQASTITGTALLEDATDHSNTLIEFHPLSPSAQFTSIVTNSDGSFSTEVANGLYSVTYSKVGYQTFEIESILIDSDTELSEVTLTSGVERNVSGPVNGVWTADTTYYVTGNIYIQSGKELEIKPGTNVVFDGFYTFSVSGKLMALGTTDSLILFTSGKNQKNNGDWEGVHFNSSNDTSKLKNVILEYAALDLNEDGGIIKISGGKVVIEESEIRHSQSVGIFCQSGYLNIRNSEIHNCDEYGIRNWGTATIENNQFHNIYLYGVNNSGSGSTVGNIFYGGSRGLQIFNTNVEVKRNIFSGLTSHAINIVAQSPLISSNTFIDNSVALNIENSGVNPSIQQNIFYDNSTAVNNENGIELSVAYNLFSSNSRNIISGQTGFGSIVTTNSNGTNADTYFNIFELPDFYSLDINCKYYAYLKPTSQAINAGDPSNFDDDGSISDIGALNYDNEKPGAFNLISSDLYHFSYDSIALQLNWQNSIDSDDIATSVFYRLTILNEINQEVLRKENISDTIFTITEFNALDQNQSYKWTVESSDDLETRIANDTLEFQIPNLPPSEIIVITPQNETTLADIDNAVLEWEDNLDTDEISYSLVFQGIGIDTLISQITNSFYDISDMIVPNNSYTWLLIASDLQDSTFTDTLSFVTPNIAPTQFDLLAPINNDTLDSFLEIAFLWNESEDLESLIYDLHIYNESFDTLIVVGEDTSRLVNLIDLEPNTLHFWEVLASDGIDTTYSVSNIFFTDNVSPTRFELLTPEDNQTLSQSDSVLFSWTKSMDMDQVYYDVHIFGNDRDTTIYSIVDTTIVFQESSFFGSSERYEWSIKAYDQYDSIYSDTLSFVSPLILSLSDFSSHTKIFPNPFKQSIKISSDFLIKNVELLELGGKLIPITNEITNNKNELEIKPQIELQKGIYVLRIFGENEDPLIFRIIKSE